jgi:hypothetical protein
VTPVYSERLAARLWWWLLPYAGVWGYRDEDYPRENWRWWWPLTFIAYYAWRLVAKLPSSAPFEPQKPVICWCGDCKRFAPFDHEAAGDGNAAATAAAAQSRESRPENHSGSGQDRRSGRGE